MPLTTQVTVKVKAALSNALDLGSAIGNIDADFSFSLINGTGLNAANNVWSDRRTLNAASNEDIDLSGVLTSALGVSLVFTKIKLIIIRAAVANTANLAVTRPASNGLAFLTAAGDGLSLTPGDFFALSNRSSAGIAVVAATGDLININNASGASQSYDIIIVGVTA